MAFCNSCGATLAAGTKFCNKCGATVSAAPAAAPVMSAPASGPAAAPSKGGSSALKIILIIVAVIVVIGIVGVASIGFIGYRIAKSTHVHQENGEVKVDTPFGKVETSSDPSSVAKDLGVDLYPGADMQKNGTATATFGNIHTVSAAFTTTDSLDKVCAFYKERFPNAMVSNADSSHCSFMSNDQKNMITVNAQSSGDTVKVQISNVSKTK
jgi:hypothetical protein